MQVTIGRLIVSPSQITNDVVTVGKITNIHRSNDEMHFVSEDDSHTHSLLSRQHFSTSE